VPARVKFIVIFLATSGVAAVSAVACLSCRVSPVLSVLTLIAGAAAALWAVFVYYPKFDPTGNTFWRGPRKDMLVSLTFDDGPSCFTAPILDALKARGVKATFFFLADNARRHPDIVERARAEGHAIGNHGATHKKMHRLTAAEIEREIVAGESALGAISTLSGKKLLRVPHGFKSIALIKVVRRLGYVLAGWTSGVWDSDRPGVDVIVQRAREAVRPGCILLLHDGDGTIDDPDRSQTARAVPGILDDCLSSGYKFVTMPQLFENREVT
jgi:peptidoglycan/xylan/chitin deacetylase (PgdA/CDA1 family)